MRHMWRIAALATVIAGASVTRGAEGWLTDWKQAKATAKDGGKDILIDFTGSDWCGWCIRLNKEVFSQDGFVTYAAEELVLMEVDFPRKTELPPELKAQNEALRDEFQVRGYPTLFLADDQGRPFAQTGYRKGGDQDYIKHLRELHAVRVERDAAFALATEAEGLEKARHLVDGLAPIAATLLPFYRDIMAQIQALDPENKTGFGERLTELQLEELQPVLTALVRGNERDKALAEVDAFIEAKKPVGELLQKVMLAKLVAFPASSAESLAQADALIDEIIAVDADTDTAKGCADIKKRIAELTQRFEKE